MRKKSQEREQARALRTQEHLSIGTIAERLGVAKSSVYEWTKDLPTPQQARRDAPALGQSNPLEGPLGERQAPRCRTYAHCPYCKHELEEQERESCYCDNCHHSTYLHLLPDLNAFDPHFPWEPHSARKEHEDEFGVPIADGETYFKKQIGVGWSDVAKLSLASLQQLLRLTIGQSPYLQLAGQTLREEQEKEFFERAQRILNQRRWPWESSEERLEKDPK